MTTRESTGAATRVEVIVTAEGLRRLRPEWDALLRAASADTVFLTWEWLLTWWEVYGAGAQLRVLTARDVAGRLIGLAPLKVVSHRVMHVGFDRVEFIGWGKDVTPEYLDFIVWRGWEERVVPLFVEYLMRSSGVVLDLGPFRADSPALGTLTDTLAERGDEMRHLPVARSPILDLPETVDAFMASRSRNYRKKVREYERRCNRDLAASVRMSQTPEELERDMAALVSLHHKRWNGTSRAFRTDEYRRFHREVAARLMSRGWMRMFTLETASRPLAMLYCFAYGHRYYYYQGGWDPDYASYRVGLVLMHRVVQQAIAEEARVFDFLRGEEEYKYRWATRHVSSVRLTAYRGVGVRTVSTATEFVGRIVAALVS